MKIISNEITPDKDFENLHGRVEYKINRSDFIIDYGPSAMIEKIKSQLISHVVDQIINDREFMKKVMDEVRIKLLEDIPGMVGKLITQRIIGNK